MVSYCGYGQKEARLDLADLPDTSFTLQIVSSGDQMSALQGLPKKYLIQNAADLEPLLEQLLDSFRQEAYFAASIDSLFCRGDVCFAFLFTGASYNTFFIENGNVDNKVLKATGLTTYFDRAITYSEFLYIREELLSYGENNGFPFSFVRLSGFRVVDKMVRGKLFWDKGRLFRISKLISEEENNLKLLFLENYLSLKKGSIYRKHRISETSRKLNELPFVRELRPPYVSFEEEEAAVHLFLKSEKANRFNFLIGILPNNRENGKVLITGDLDAQFQNQFGRGEKIHLQFEQLRSETQKLIFAHSYPYLFNTAIGLDVAFGLYKRDTTYRDLSWNLGFQYYLEEGGYLKAFSKNVVSTLLTIDSERVIQQKSLPINVDIRFSSFGLAYHLERLDYRFNPRSGWLVNLEGNGGFRKIRKNNKILDLLDQDNPGFDFTDLYQAIDLNTFQFQFSGRVDRYFSIGKGGTFKSGIQGAGTFSETSVFTNEQFRIGGNRLLRGFDEESVFATVYAVGTLEYRYLIGANSYLFLFGDFAYIRNKTRKNDFTDWPMGLGAGISFETKAGVFGVSYAVGRLKNEVFEFKRAKIHFGLVNLF